MTEESGLKVVGDDDGQDIDPVAIEEAKRLDSEISELLGSNEKSSWELSLKVQEMHNDAKYQALGCTTWKSYVEEHLDIGMRKASYLFGIRDWMDKLAPAMQEWVMSLGWSKARLLVNKFGPENSAEWKAKIDGKSYREISDLLKGVLDTDDDGEGGEGGEGGTEEKLEKVTLSLYPGQKETWDSAIDHASTIADSDKKGNLATLIASDFLATNTNIDNVNEYLEKVERMVGFKIIAYDEENNEIVHGAKFVAKLVDAGNN